MNMIVLHVLLHFKMMANMEYYVSDQREIW